MAIRRPFAGKNIGEPLDGSAPTADQGQGQPQQQPVRAARLPLPTPALPASPASTPTVEQERESIKPVTASPRLKLENAKKLLKNAGVDPAILDRLVERSTNIDREIEKIQLQIEELQRKMRELSEEKQRINKIISALAQA